MFERILVPLDGSATSDAVLFTVRRLLLANDGAEVVLLRILEPFAHPRAEQDERPGAGVETSALPLRREAAERHLADLVTRLVGEGVDARSEVRLGDPATEVVRAVEALDASLVAMASHGRSGPARWLLGSVAERVLRSCPCPLLLVNASAAEHSVHGVVFRRILVPLDGSALAARVVPLAGELARRAGAEVVLARFGWHPTSELPAASSIALPETEDELRASLAPAQSTLAALGVPTRTRVGYGAAAGQILDAVAAEEADLVAMTTHGRSGLDRWAFGSVAEKVLRACPVPLLALRVVTPSGER